MSDIKLKSLKFIQTEGLNKIFPVEPYSKEEDLNESEDELQIKEEEKKDNWSNQSDYLFQAISYCVGLGAFWRFPYVAYQNGGGGFLVPFLICLILIGMPMLYLEQAVGQFSSRGLIRSWSMTPLFKGVGISMNIINAFVNIYYIMVVGYAIYYFVLSFFGDLPHLPWSKCDPKWSEKTCLEDFNSIKCISTNESIALKCDDGYCYSIRNVSNETINFGFEYLEEITNNYANFTEKFCTNQTNMTIFNVTKKYWDPSKYTYASRDYWNNYVLEKSNHILEPGTFVWQLIIVVLVAWILCFLSLFKGVKLSGKISYITTILPYIILTIFLVFGLIQEFEGASKGILYFFMVKPEKLIVLKTWVQAGVQVFYTLSLSYGGMVTLSSYNKFDNNFLRDTIIICFTNAITCILAGTVVFSFIGIIAEDTGLDISEAIQESTGLVFIALPYAINALPFPVIWSLLLFLMLFALGMGTMISSVETLSSSLEDFFPVLKKNMLNKSLHLGSICLVYFLLNLILCLQGGMYWFDFLNEYSGNWSLLTIGFIECISVSWFYGLSRFKTDLNAMGANMKIFWIWEITLAIITPLGLAILIGSQFYDLISIEDTLSTIIINKDETFQTPQWIEIIGQLISTSCLFGIVGWMFYAVFDVIKKKKSFRSLIETDSDWTPLYESNKQLVRYSYLKPQKSIFSFLSLHKSQDSKITT